MEKELKIMNGLSYIEGALYNYEGKFSNIGTFLDFLSPYFEGVSFNKSEVLEKTIELVDFFSEEETSTIDQEKAFKLLICGELKNCLSIFKNLEVEDPFLKMDEYSQSYNKFFSHFFDGAIEFPDLFLVDEFPKPYDNMKMDALAPNKADKEMYNITPGIYLSKEFLSPYYSAYLLPHEMIHVFVSKANPYLLGRGLEEGIADLLGSIYGGMNILGYDVIKNITIYNRFSNISSYWDMYRDYLRQAAFIYHNFGFAGIKELILG